MTHVLLLDWITKITVRLGAHLQLFVLKQFVSKMDHMSLNETSHTSNFLVSLKTKEIGFFRYNETILFSKSFKCAPSLIILF